MFGCSGGEEDTTYESPEGETADIDPEDAGKPGAIQEGATVIGTDAMEPL